MAALSADDFTVRRGATRPVAPCRASAIAAHFILQWLCAMPIAVTTDCDHAAWIHLLSFSDRPLTPAQAVHDSSQAG